MHASLGMPRLSRGRVFSHTLATDYRGVGCYRCRRLRQRRGLGLGRGWRRRPREGMCISSQQRFAARSSKVRGLAALDVVALGVEMLSCVVLLALPHSATGAAPVPCRVRSRRSRGGFRAASGAGRGRSGCTCAQKSCCMCCGIHMQLSDSLPPSAYALHNVQSGTASSVPRAHHRARYASGPPLAGCRCANFHVVRH